MNLASRRASLVIAVMVLAACSTTPPAATSTAPPGSTLGPVGGVTFEPPTSFGPPPSPSAPDDTTPLAIDPTLLAILPEAINTIPLTESVDEATQALNNVFLADIASAVDAAVAVDTGNGDLVYTWIVRLRPGAFTDTGYRQWRDSYDDGACSAAGGVTGRAEATIDERTVYVTSCAVGLRTYHVWLEDQDILISASALGDGLFGELLVGQLRVP